MDGPVILCGFGRLGQRVLECLRAADVPVVVIDDRVKGDNPRLAGVRVIPGDFRDQTVLVAAGVLNSRGVLILTSNDLVNFSAALLVRQLSPSVRVVIRLFNQNLLSQLGKAISNVVPLSMSALAAPLLALTAATGEVLGTFPVGTDQFQVAELTVGEKSPLAGLTIADVNRVGHYLLISHSLPGQPATFLRDIPLDHPIAAGEKLTLAGRIGDIRKLREPDSEAEIVRWAGRLRRYGRIAYRTFAEFDLAVKICSITMLIVVMGSTATYHWGLNQGWASGLYKTISVIATGSELGARDDPEWGKVFVSVLKIFGTVLVAAFTAILTNFLIRARLGGVFEVRRIPETGHVVVIGLGNVGFRVVEELLRLGEKPVVIEAKKEDTLVNKARRMGVPVVIGDGASREVLKQARVREARAVICTTGDDLLNLEIALMVGDLKPLQRVVVRLGDAALAETARSAAGVKMALSLPDLAAPAFAAGLLGDRVSSLFQSGGRTLAIVEFNITEADEHGFVGRSLKALAIDHRFLPLAVFDENGVPREYRHSNQKVQAGERLLVILPLSQLDQITRKIQPSRRSSVWVSQFPLSAKSEMLARVRERTACGDEEAEAIIAEAPFLIAEDLSDGEAEELVDLFLREKVTATIRTRGRERD